jgi:hypothetical protein
MLRLHALRLSEAGEAEARSELTRVAENFRLKLAEWPEFGAVEDSALDSSPMRMVDSSVAARYHADLHYLTSARPEGVHLGLFAADRDLPFTLLSFVAFDLDHLRPHLPDGTLPEQVLVLARQVTVGTTPANAWSFAFGRACRWLRRNRPEVRLLITYLDVNLGFRGASYRAANWRAVADEPKGRYVFVDGTPITNRELVQRFGTARFDDLVTILGSRITRTAVPLRPLSVLGYALLHPDRRRSAALFSGNRVGE